MSSPSDPRRRTGIVEDGQAITLMAFTVSGGKIVEIDGITDLDRLRQLHLNLAALQG